jgi:hypothetical protein
VVGGSVVAATVVGGSVVGIVVGSVGGGVVGVVGGVVGVVVGGVGGVVGVVVVVVITGPSGGRVVGLAGGGLDDDGPLGDGPVDVGEVDSGWPVEDAVPVVRPVCCVGRVVPELSVVTAETVGGALVVTKSPLGEVVNPANTGGGFSTVSPSAFSASSGTEPFRPRRTLKPPSLRAGRPRPTTPAPKRARPQVRTTIVFCR